MRRNRSISWSRKDEEVAVLGYMVCEDARGFFAVDCRSLRRKAGCSVILNCLHEPLKQRFVVMGISRTDQMAAFHRQQRFGDWPLR